MAKAQKKAAAKAVTKPKISDEVVQENSKKLTKAEQVIKLLQRKGGAKIPDIQKVTGWQVHSVRGFLSVLRKRGLKVERRMVEGQKDAYHIVGA